MIYPAFSSVHNVNIKWVDYEKKQFKVLLLSTFLLWKQVLMDYYFYPLQKKEYDFIIFDAPPVLKAPETSMLSRQFDGTILIIEENRTVRSGLQRTKQEIIEAGGKILGFILNRKKSIYSQKYTANISEL